MPLYFVFMAKKVSNIPLLIFPPWRGKQLFIISRHATWWLLFACRVRFVIEIHFPSFLLTKDKTSGFFFNQFHSRWHKWHVINQMYIVKDLLLHLIHNDMINLGHYGVSSFWLESPWFLQISIEITISSFQPFRVKINLNNEMY